MTSLWRRHDVTKWICLSLNSQKKVWRWTTFLILLYMSHVTEVWRMPTTRDCWSRLFYFFIFAIVLNLLIPTKKILTITHDHHSSLTVLWGGATKKTATTAAMATDAAGHCCGYGLSRLHRWVLPPLSNNAGLFHCCQGWGGGYFASRARHSAARTVQKFKY